MGFCVGSATSDLALHWSFLNNQANRWLLHFCPAKDSLQVPFLLHPHEILLQVDNRTKTE
jgi:hypothetical protein